MNKTKQQSILAALLSLALPVLSWADITNTAAATYRDATNAPYGASSNQVTVTVIVPPTIVLTKSASPTTARSGDTVTFTIAYQNTGGSNATNVAITDVIPVGSTLVVGSISGGGAVSAGTITWSIATVAPNASGSVSFRVTVN